MSIKLNCYSLHRYSDSVGNEVYLLIDVVRPEFPNASGAAEEWAEQRRLEMASELRNKFEHSEYIGTKKAYELIGEWIGAILESDALKTAEQFDEFVIWYSKDLRYRGYIGFELCDTEDEFWLSMSDAREEGIDIDDLEKPAKRIKARYLRDYTYSDGGFPYKNLGKAGW